ncbi:unnamed protein product [Discula destructiva]
MFAQQWTGDMPSKKRGRDDDGDSDVAIGGTEGFTEHRNKRLQSLPFRTSPASKRLSFPPSFNSGPVSIRNSFEPHQHNHKAVPSHSDSEHAHRLSVQRAGFVNSTSPSPSLVMPRPVEETAFSHAPEMVDGYRAGDLDMDMDMDVADISQAHNFNHLGAGPSQPDPVQPGGITSRMPTPIHCSFAAQVRGNNWGGAAGNALHSSGFAPPPDQSVPRSLDHNAMTDYDHVCDRRLPSPISEGGADELGSPRMVLDTQLRQGLPPRAASAMDFTAPERTPSVHSTFSDLAGESNSTRSSYSGHTSSSNCDGCVADDLANANAMDIEHSIPSPKKGHTRSRHTLNSWTQNVPGMKKTFSIGYRADCEKCRLKVPGHFNHIIVS